MAKIRQALLLSQFHLSLSLSLYLSLSLSLSKFLVEKQQQRSALPHLVKQQKQGSLQESNKHIFLSNTYVCTSLMFSSNTESSSFKIKHLLFQIMANIF
jgi:hypothetical protein